MMYIIIFHLYKPRPSNTFFWEAIYLEFGLIMSLCPEYLIYADIDLFRKYAEHIPYTVYTYLQWA